MADEDMMDTPPLASLHQIDWSFRFSNSSPLTDLLRTSRPDDVLEFASGLETVRFMAEDSQDLHVRLQAAIDERIDAEPTAGRWRQARTRLNRLQHFPRYRRNEFDRYHDAARARAAGTASVDELELVEGLNAEVASSKVIVPAGQVLFHGRANSDLNELLPFPSFVSTSLNPVVARQSAFRRAGPEQQFGRPRVYVLTMAIASPALWGQTGRSCEYELLLPTGLTFSQTCLYEHSNFEVVAAVVSR